MEEKLIRRSSNIRFGALPPVGTGKQSAPRGRRGLAEPLEEARYDSHSVCSLGSLAHSLHDRTKIGSIIRSAMFSDGNVGPNVQGQV